MTGLDQEKPDNAAQPSVEKPKSRRRSRKRSRKASSDAATADSSPLAASATEVAVEDPAIVAPPDDEVVVPDIEGDDEEIVAVQAEAERPVEEILEELADLTAASDPVRMYLREIGRHALLTPEQEKSKSRRVRRGSAAEEELKEEGLSPEREAELRLLVEDGERAAGELARSNLRLVVSWAKRYAGRGGMSTVAL